MKQERDHIFISYATEQSALCDWLARRLAAEGYAIWCDRQKLLGGENWPNDIDAAINERTFRMLALLSRASMKKRNPQGEWLKGNAIGKELGIDDFVIPLNTEGLRPDEIIWNLQPINYIPFTPSWVEGLAALLKKLASVDTPRALRDGPRLAVESIVASSAVRDEPEILVSNCFEITQVPRFVRKYKLTFGRLSIDVRRALQREWACRDVSPTSVLAFEDPPSTVTARHRFQYFSQVPWRGTEFVDGINSRDLVVSLIYRCLDSLLRDKGMKYSTTRKHGKYGRHEHRKHGRHGHEGQWYLPQGLIDKDRVSVTFPSGKKSWFKGVGERTYPTTTGREVYRYHLSPSFSVLRGQADPFFLLLRNRVYLTDVNGIPLDERKVKSRRKHLCKAWFNSQWCARILGIAQLLADGDTHIRLGPEGEQQLVISAMPIVPNSPQSIHDELVDEPDEIFATLHDED